MEAAVEGKAELLDRLGAIVRRDDTEAAVEAARDIARRFPETEDDVCRAFAKQWGVQAWKIVQDLWKEEGPKAEASSKKPDLEQKVIKRAKLEASSKAVGGEAKPKLSDYGEPKRLKALTPKQREDLLVEVSVKKGKALSEVVKQPSTALAFQHSKNPSGIVASLENAGIALGELMGLGLECRYDVFHDKLIVRGPKAQGDELADLEKLDGLDKITLKLRAIVLDRFRFDPGGYIGEAVLLRCLENSFDPVRDYLDGLQWDGHLRLDRWLITYGGADDTAFNRAVGRTMLVAGVARVREPGCKFDNMPVLEGKQGMLKSTALRVMFGSANFSDSEIIGLDKREQQEAVQGVWGQEVSELEGMKKASAAHLKHFLSKQDDKARPAYAKSRIDQPRRTIFVGTTNEDKYLKDMTGNRRIWPVKLHGVVWSAGAKMKRIDIEGLKRDRDQLWAEAATAQAAGEALYIPDALWGDAEVQQKARMHHDPWNDVITVALEKLDWIKGKEGLWSLASDIDGKPEWRVSSHYLISRVLWISDKDQRPDQATRLGDVMRDLGWTYNEKTMKVEGKACRGYIKSGDAPQVEVIPDAQVEILPPAPQGLRRI